MTKPVRLFLGLLLLSLAGCGRAGPLEPAPGTPATQPTASVNTASTTAGGIPVIGPVETTTGSNATPGPKGQPFLLDPLVK